MFLSVVSVCSCLCECLRESLRARRGERATEAKARREVCPKAKLRVVSKEAVKQKQRLGKDNKDQKYIISEEVPFIYIT